MWINILVKEGYGSFEVGIVIFMGNDNIGNIVLKGFVVIYDEGNGIGLDIIVMIGLFGEVYIKVFSIYFVKIFLENVLV